jgi:hypothetical protein
MRLNPLETDFVIDLQMPIAGGWSLGCITLFSVLHVLFHSRESRYYSVLLPSTPGFYLDPDRFQARVNLPGRSGFQNYGSAYSRLSVCCI